MSRRALRRALLAAAAALLVLAAPGASGAAWTTNLVQLDNGTCGTNLQIGSDRAGSSSATPSFFLQGDGGLSSYAVSIDGSPLGTFASSGGGNVCITAGALANGPHTLTATELAPNPSLAVAPLAFTVDTLAPKAPSAPSLSRWSDSGVVGDGITKYPNVNFTGTCGPNEAVLL